MVYAKSYRSLVMIKSATIVPWLSKACWLVAKLVPFSCKAVEADTSHEPATFFGWFLVPYNLILFRIRYIFLYLGFLIIFFICRNRYTFCTRHNMYNNNSSNYIKNLQEEYSRAFRSFWRLLLDNTKASEKHAKQAIKIKEK